MSRRHLARLSAALLTTVLVLAATPASAHVTVSSTDARNDPRWPALSHRAPEQRTPAIAVPVQSGDRSVGVLTAYVAGDEPAMVSTEVLEMFAVAIGGVLHEVELLEELDRVGTDLQRALESRAVIDQAKGIIMGSQGVDAAAAWEHLLQLSSTQHMKVRDVAQRVVDQAQKWG